MCRIVSQRGPAIPGSMPTPGMQTCSFTVRRRASHRLWLSMIANGDTPMPNTLNDAIQRRYACHEFAKGKPVSADELAWVLEAGRLAPSAFGLEPWRFIVVTDAAGRAAVAQACYG